MALLSILILPALTGDSKTLTLPLLWKVSHLVFAIAMFSTFFVQTVFGGTEIVALVGTSWAITQWVPYAIVGQEMTAASSAKESQDEAANMHGPDRMSGVGATLGLHNAFIAAPQIIAAIFCACLFKLFDVLEVDDNFGWVLRCAGISGEIAAWMSWDLD